MMADSVLTHHEIFEFHEAATLVRKGQNTEVSICCSSLTTKETGHTLQGPARLQQILFSLKVVGGLHFFIC